MFSRNLRLPSLKMTTSEIVVYEAQLKNFFYFIEKPYSLFEIFKSAILGDCELKMSISTPRRMHFRVYLVNRKMIVCDALHHLLPFVQ